MRHLPHIGFRHNIHNIHKKYTQYTIYTSRIVPMVGDTQGKIHYSTLPFQVQEKKPKLSIKKIRSKVGNPRTLIPNQPQHPGQLFPTLPPRTTLDTRRNRMKFVERLNEYNKSQTTWRGNEQSSKGRKQSNLCVHKRRIIIQTKPLLCARSTIVLANFILKQATCKLVSPK